MNRRPLDAIDWTALAVAALALLVRLPGLHLLALHGDEDISTLVARGILETGLPTLPSGVPYVRSPIFHYAIAPLIASGVDWLPRLFSVLCSTLTAVAIVRLGREIVGRHAAAIAAILFVLSIQEIEVARTTRMYALYQLASLLVVVLLHRFWRTGALRWSYLATVAVGVSMFTHQLGATLAALAAPLALVRETTRRARLVLVTGGAIVIVMGGLYRRLSMLTRHAGGERVRELDPGTDEAVRTTFRGLIADSPLGLGESFAIFPLVVALAVLLGGGLALAFTRRGDPHPMRRSIAVAGVAIAIGLAGAHQLGLAAALWVLLLLLRPELYPERSGRTLLVAAAAAIGACGVGWTAVAVSAGYSVPDVVAGLTRWPGRLGRFFLWPPAIALAALPGMAVILLRSLMGRAHDGGRFLVIVVVGLTTIRGVLGDETLARYLVDVWPLQALLAGWSVATAAGWIGAPLAPSRRRRVRIAGALTAAIVVLALPGTGVRSIAGTLSLVSGEVPPSGTRISRVADTRGAAAFVDAHREEDDRIVATDWLNAYCYTGRVDGWIRWQEWARQSRRFEGVVRDVYISARVLPDLDALTEYLRHERTWIIAGGGELGRGGVKVSPAVREWLLAREPMWIDAHGYTRVYLVDDVGGDAGEDVDASP